MSSSVSVRASPGRRRERGSTRRPGEWVWKVVGTHQFWIYGTVRAPFWIRHVQVMDVATSFPSSFPPEPFFLNLSLAAFSALSRASATACGKRLATIADLSERSSRLSSVTMTNPPKGGMLQNRRQAPGNSIIVQIKVAKELHEVWIGPCSLSNPLTSRDSSLVVALLGETARPIANIVLG